MIKATTEGGKLSKNTLILSFTAVCSFLILFCVVPYAEGYGFVRKTILTLVRHGYTQENGEWGFGYIVLPAALVMLWLTRKRYQSIELKPSWAGLGLIVLSLVFYMAGFKANEKYIGYFSGHLLIAGMVIWLAGWKYFFKAFWLWVFLVMMWPLLPLIDIISFRMRKIATEVTVFLWNIFGGNALQNGTSIINQASEGVAEGEGYSLQIAAACSGMRSLFALLMISLIFAYIGVKKVAHSIIVVLAMFPIAIAANVVRIILLLGGTVIWGNEFAVGSDAEPSGYHLGAGFAVYFVALFCMIVLVGTLNGGISKVFSKKKVVSKIVNKVDV